MNTEASDLKRGDSLSPTTLQLPGNPLDFIDNNHLREPQVYTTLDRIATDAVADRVALDHVQEYLAQELPLHLGDEVRQAGDARAGGEIRDINTPMLSAALAAPATEIAWLAKGADNLDGLSRQLADLADRVDLIATTGGPSVGETDHVKPALAGLGAEIVFSGVAIKPGKPVSVGRLGGALWIGLPVNPLSSFVTRQLFGTGFSGG